MKNQAITSTLVGIAMCGAANAQVLVTSDITTSTTWTANNVYSLQDQIYVTNGATLTIEAGTVIASTANLGGSLAIARGSKIEALGTELNPIIWTSTNDTATWVGGDPENGTWRQTANEWGNLTIMGNGYISEDITPGNTQGFNAANFAFMEGLVGNTNDQKYGGGDDNDNSGTVKYCSFRYGGKVIGLNNELNGLSLGGIGRGTTIHHVEIMNNVDDGVEIWGGAVNLRQISIWNVGDDSFDVDQGWRGTAQQVFIVQGASTNASSGSGHGDNAFETDGAEQSHHHPVTTACIYNATVIGSPEQPNGNGVGGTDRATAWRDNARVQYRNCIFMDIGERVVGFDNIDGDGGAGYGHLGTTGWPAIWSTAYNNFVGPNVPAQPLLDQVYTAQFSGNACEIKDSITYRCRESGAYSNSNGWNALGLSTGHDNVVEPTGMPIVALTRGVTLPTASGGILPVATIDPLPANDALTPVSFAPAGSGFESLRVRGAFLPGNNWCTGWTAADHYDFLLNDGWTDLGNTSAGVNGAPVADATGTMASGTTTTYSLSNGPASSIVVGMIGFRRGDTDLGPFGFPGLTIVPDFATLGNVVLVSGPNGTASFNFTMVPGYAGRRFYAQFFNFDSAAPNGVSLSNAIYRVAQ